MENQRVFIILEKTKGLGQNGVRTIRVIVNEARVGERTSSPNIAANPEALCRFIDEVVGADPREKEVKKNEVWEFFFQNKKEKKNGEFKNR